MPNWCSGNVIVRGKPESIKKFCRLFIFEDDEDDEGELQQIYREREFKKGRTDIRPHIFFARSFVNTNWNDFKQNELVDLEEEQEAEFNVDFAWSGNSCLISGYPQERENCITLEEGCKMCDVDVVKIKTEEGGEGIEEEITYSKKEGLDYEQSLMPTYKCKNCGNTQFIHSYMDLEEEECMECEENKWEKISEEE